MTPRTFEKGGVHVTEDNESGYGYPEQVPEKQVVERTVLEASIETVDITNVVKAIYSLG